jgi:SAM-dependent methyltransferase
VHPVTTHVDPTNTAMAQRWDGPSGEFWVEHADVFESQVAAYRDSYLAATGIEPGAHVLDVGCGSGRTAREAARLVGPTGRVTGIDLSGPMLELARRRAAAEGLDTVSFEQADAQVADLGTARYDRVISRNGVMFFGDPVTAFANLARALRPDGRLVVLVWQSLAENEWYTDFRTAGADGRALPPLPPDAPGPFALGDPGRVRAVLTAAGFAEPELAGLRRTMIYGPDVATAETMALSVIATLLDELDDAGRQRARAALRRTLEEHLGPAGVAYRSAMWIITAAPVASGGGETYGRVRSLDPS